MCVCVCLCWNSIRLPVFQMKQCFLIQTFQNKNWWMWFCWCKSYPFRLTFWLKCSLFFFHQIKNWVVLQCKLKMLSSFVNFWKFLLMQKLNITSWCNKSFGGNLLCESENIHTEITLLFCKRNCYLNHNSADLKRLRFFIRHAIFWKLTTWAGCEQNEEKPQTKRFSKNEQVWRN